MQISAYNYIISVKGLLRPSQILFSRHSQQIVGIIMLIYIISEIIMGLHVDYTLGRLKCRSWQAQ